MLNNSSTYEPNETPANMVTCLNGSRNSASNISQNLSDFRKYMNHSPSSTSEYYEARNAQTFGQPPVNIVPIMNPFQAYQSVGQGSAYPPQNSQFSYQNAMQDLFEAANSVTQAENHCNMYKFSQNDCKKTLSELLTAPKREPYFAKGYPLNIPQLSTMTFQRSLTSTKNDINTQNVVQNSATVKNVSEIPTNLVQKSSLSENSSSNSSRSISPSSNTIPDIPEEHRKAFDHCNVEVSKQTSENISVDSSTPSIKKTTYNIIVKNNFNENTIKTTSMLDKCLSESKRKSLNKTIQIIERILIKTSNPCTKSDVAENPPDDVKDPLALPPIKIENSDNIEGICSQSETDSDNEALSKKVMSKRKKKVPLHNSIHTDSQISESAKETQTNQQLIVKIEDIKIEPNWDEEDSELYQNLFIRDNNGSSKESVIEGKIIKKENSLEEALATIKSGSKSTAYFECPHCSLLLLHPKRFLIHTKWHTFGLLNQKRVQMARERGERNREKREARTVQRLRGTSESGGAAATHPCKDCGSTFPTKTSLKNHRRKAHPTGGTECKVCYIPLPNLKSLREHMKSHAVTGGGGYQCPHCDKRFKYRHSLTKHIDTHLEKTHSCNVCGKLFGSLALVRVHSVTHVRAARGRAHRCSYCGKGFSEAYNLHVHERTHRNDKPFQCDICMSCFVTNSSLKRHVKVSHSGAKPFPCPVCQKCFSSASIRDRHELRVHSDLRQLPFPCQVCGTRFMKQKDLRNHTYRLHPKEKKINQQESDTEIKSSHSLYIPTEHKLERDK